MSKTNSEDQIIVKTQTDEFRLTGKLCELSGFSHVPGNRSQAKERNNFNAASKPRFPELVYDRMFYRDYGYDQSLPRCEHYGLKRLEVCEEERAKQVPSLSSSEYGRHIERPVERVEKRFGRVAHIKAEFFRKNGVTF